MQRETQDQIDMYVGRGVLIESDLAWLWGTASEHAVMYQYQLSNTSNILLAMIQTESPYFQPTPSAPMPFHVGMFPNDPAFTTCAGGGAAKCGFSWAVRIIDSSTIYMLGSGLYSWFSNYAQTCLSTGDCQTRGFEVEESFDIWIYNLCTKGIVEMISPVGATATLARDNANGFLSFMLAWLQGSQQVAGRRPFPGFQVYTSNELAQLKSFPDSCRTALAQTVACDGYVHTWVSPAYRKGLHNNTRTDSVCDPGCGQNLGAWFTNVKAMCVGFNITDALPTVLGGRMWAAYNETCLQDASTLPTNKYCNDAIDDFPVVAKVQDMATADICSPCFVKRRAMMRDSGYSTYDERYKLELQYIYLRCGQVGLPTSIPPTLVTLAGPNMGCGTNDWYTTTSASETCASVALTKGLSSAALFAANQNRVLTCRDDAALPVGTLLCLPPPCARTYTLKANDTCAAIESTQDLRSGDVRRLNPWVGFGCVDLLAASATVYGGVICLDPPGGAHNASAPLLGGIGSGIGDTATPQVNDGYTYLHADPPAGATVAIGSTLHCGRWHVAAVGDTCTSICIQEQVTIALFLQVNPSLGTAPDACMSHLVAGNAYCVAPNYDWENPRVPNTSILTTYTVRRSTPTSSSQASISSSSSVLGSSSAVYASSTAHASSQMTPSSTTTSSAVASPTYT